MEIKIEKRRCGWIYLWRNNINGKGYIGKTTDIGNMKYRHKHGVKAGHDKVFYHAVRKYGWDAFDFKILCSGNWIKAELNQQEIFCIQEWGTFVPNGYNMTKGGDGGKMKGTRDKVRTRWKRMNTMRKRKQDPLWISPLIGRKQTEAHKRNRLSWCTTIYSSKSAGLAAIRSVSGL